MAEGRCCNSYALVVGPCTDCLAVPVEHISGDTEAADTRIVGVAIVGTSAVVESSVAPCWYCC